jgi:hypothetical protein
MLRSYKELHVWKRSLILVTDIYRLTRILPPDERFGLNLSFAGPRCPST